MGVVRRSGRWRDPAVAYLGRQVAAALIAGDPGDANGREGWRGALQVAATITRNESGVLFVADEIYAAAADLGTPAAVRAYASSTALVVHGGAGRALLDGMLEHVDGPT